MVEPKDPDHYRVLEVNQDASADEIKASFKKIALRCHPDKNLGNPDANIEFQKLGEAHEVLSDPDKRRSYDNQYPRIKAEWSAYVRVRTPDKTWGGYDTAKAQSRQEKHRSDREKRERLRKEWAETQRLEALKLQDAEAKIRVLEEQEREAHEGLEDIQYQQSKRKRYWAYFSSLIVRDDTTKWVKIETEQERLRLCAVLRIKRETLERERKELKRLHDAIELIMTNARKLAEEAAREEAIEAEQKRADQKAEREAQQRAARQEYERRQAAIREEKRKADEAREANIRQWEEEERKEAEVRETAIRQWVEEGRKAAIACEAAKRQQAEGRRKADEARKATKTQRQRDYLDSLDGTGERFMEKYKRKAAAAAAARARKAAEESRRERFEEGLKKRRAEFEAALETPNANLTASKDHHRPDYENDRSDYTTSSGSGSSHQDCKHQRYWPKIKGV
ncbi:MAG: hypothetical protein M1825_000433 [Sarcosagium campestre]|nr:MAG: hypothetical protein M1825_000433 [Sarcosagium campestre]